jgi:hypothetical protein
MAPEFDQDNPLLVDIEISGGKWDIQVSGTANYRNTKTKQFEKMIERISGFPNLLKEYDDKKVKGAPDPEFKDQTKHRSIVVQPGETVVFRCDNPFKLFAHKDPNVVPDVDSLENPFGWTKIQKSGGGLNFVTATVDANPAPNQRFYKCIAWVTDGSDTILVDPDCIF